MNKVILIIIFLLSFGCEDESIYDSDSGTTLGYTSSECVTLETDCAQVSGEYILTSPSNTNTWQGSEFMCVCQW